MRRACSLKSMRFRRRSITPRTCYCGRCLSHPNGSMEVERRDAPRNEIRLTRPRGSAHAQGYTLAQPPDHVSETAELQPINRRVAARWDESWTEHDSYAEFATNREQRPMKSGALRRSWLRSILEPWYRRKRHFPPVPLRRREVPAVSGACSIRGPHPAECLPRR